MKFLKILEKAWLTATIAALLLSTYYLITIKAVNHLVYFPLICAGFSFLIYRNIKSQRIFLENRDKEQRH